MTSIARIQLITIKLQGRLGVRYGGGATFYAEYANRDCKGLAKGVKGMNKFRIIVYITVLS